MYVLYLFMINLGINSGVRQTVDDQILLKYYLPHILLVIMLLIQCEARRIHT